MTKWLLETKPSWKLDTFSNNLTVVLAWIRILFERNPSIKLTWKDVNYCRREPCFFLSNGYWLGVYYGLFHFQGLPRAVRNASRARITKWKVIPNVGFEPRTYSLRSEGVATELWGLMSVEWISVHLVLTVLLFRNLPTAICSNTSIQMKSTMTYT